uniref:Uncharacterized protein n=1 Tax=Timema shepardi TaxID=629360 RepID=A0A7R9G3A5_TIMSH|nr:unnamed protein product [Timema shepardi]
MIRTSISPSSAVELNTTSALANYATEAGQLSQLVVGPRNHCATVVVLEKAGRVEECTFLRVSKKYEASHILLAAHVSEGSVCSTCRIPLPPPPPSLSFLLDLPPHTHTHTSIPTVDDGRCLFASWERSEATFPRYGSPTHTHIRTLAGCVRAKLCARNNRPSDSGTRWTRDFGNLGVKPVGITDSDRQTALGLLPTVVFTAARDYHRPATLVLPGELLNSNPVIFRGAEREEKKTRDSLFGIVPEMCRCDVILARSQHPRWTSSKCMKPMLPRKLTSSARINLNQHWNVLEDLVTCEISNHVMQHGRWEDSGDTSLSNEINENLANEMLERDSADLCSSSLAQPHFSVESRPHELFTSKETVESRPHELFTSKETVESRPHKLLTSKEKVESRSRPHELLTSKEKVESRPHELFTSKETVESRPHELLTSKEKVESRPHELFTSKETVESQPHELFTPKETVESRPHELFTSKETVESRPHDLFTSKETVESRPHELLTSKEKVESRPHELFTSKETVESWPHELLTSKETVESWPHELFTSKETVESRPHKLLTSKEKVESRPHELLTSKEKVESWPHELFTSKETVESRPHELFTPKETVESRPHALFTSKETVESRPHDLFTSKETVESRPHELFTSKETAESRPHELLTSKEKVESRPHELFTSKETVES